MSHPECPTCNDTAHALAAFTAACSHEVRWCSSCVKRHIHNEMTEKVFNEKIYCPVLVKGKACRAQLSHLDIRNGAAEDDFTRYDKLLLQKTLEALPEYRPCMNPMCGNGQLHDGGDDIPIVRCQACRHRSCFTHRVPWHEGETCEAYTARLKGDAGGVVFVAHFTCRKGWRRHSRNRLAKRWMRPE